MIEEIKNKEKQEYFRGQRKCLSGLFTFSKKNQKA